MVDRYTTCPYHNIERDGLWKNVFMDEAVDFDIDVRAPFKITPSSKISTAGSCFAQHVARYLQNYGFNYFKTEDCPPFIPVEIAKSYNYGVFSARYGNIYTVRQLLQLLKRAYGQFTPVVDSWRDEGAFIDPLRPFIQPGGFDDFEALCLDRTQHLAAVRRLIEESDVFVFTLGLTEAWVDRRDGTVFPVCPGCGAGAHDPLVHKFVNFDYQEIYSELNEAIELMLQKNESLKFILTVSPVPLTATATGQNVLVATTYSKSVLRAAAGKLSAERPETIVYFPSYEIITASYSRGAYFASDLRTVTEDGVARVMNIFMKNFVGKIDDIETVGNRASPAFDENMRAVAVVCDDEKMTTELAHEQSHYFR